MAHGHRRRTVTDGPLGAASRQTRNMNRQERGLPDAAAGAALGDAALLPPPEQ